MTVAAVVYNPLNTGAPIASTDVTDTEGYQRGLLDAATSDPLNVDAEVKIQVHRTHPSVSAFTPGRIVRIIDDDGEAAKFEIRVVDDTVVADEPASETVTITGRTLMSQWREMLVQGHQAPGVEPDSSVVAYNFATPGRDMSDFTDTGHTQNRSALTVPRPAWWPDPYTAPIWPRPSSSSQPVGPVFAVRDFTLPTPARIVAWCSADNGFAFWMDGVRGLRKDDDADSPVSHKTWRAFTAMLPAGPHRLGIEAWNTGGPAAIWCSVWRTDAELLGDPILLIGSGTANPAIGHWWWNAYPPSRPGVPVLRPVVDFLARAQARQGMTGWTLGFSQTHDSNSVAAPQSELAIEDTKTGYDLLELISTDWVDFRVRKGAGLVLDAVIRPMGSTSGAAHSLDDLSSLRHRTGI